MKKLLFVMGILLGIGGSSLYIWMKPKTDDPYFFLTPKVIDVLHPLKAPISLYEKGASVNYVFWMTPLPQEKYLYILPANEPLTAITLDMENKNINNNIKPYEIFNRDGLAYIKDKEPMFLIELKKINEDLSETTIIKETKLFNSSERHKNRHILYMLNEYGYGQFRIKITVLGDWPELKHDDLKYFVKIAASTLK